MLYINDYELCENSLMALLSRYDNYKKYNHLLNHKIRGVYDLQNKKIVWSRDENSNRAYQKMYVVNEEHFYREATISNTYFDGLVDIKSVEYIGNYDVNNNNFKKKIFHGKIK